METTTKEIYRELGLTWKDFYTDQEINFEEYEKDHGERCFVAISKGMVVGVRKGTSESLNLLKSQLSSIAVNSFDREDETPYVIVLSSEEIGYIPILRYSKAEFIEDHIFELEEDIEKLKRNLAIAQDSLAFYKSLQR